MDTKGSYEIIERMNSEYLSLRESSEYTLGNLIFKLKNHLRHLRIRTVLEKLYAGLHNQKRFSDPPNNSTPIAIHEPSLGKTVVYACIAGPYDLPKEPFLPEEGIDYILYTDQPKTNKNTIWQYRIIPDKVLHLSSSGKVINEYLRLHPHDFFPGYDYSIYVDGSMQVFSDLSAWTNLIHRNTGIALHKHATCSCVYKQGRFNILWKRGRREGHKNQMAFYRKEGFPENFGLLESTVIATDLHNPIAQKIYDLWWEDFYRWNSQRDQMSIPYVLWKLGIPIEDVGTLGNNVWRNPKLRFYPHEMKKYHEAKK